MTNYSVHHFQIKLSFCILSWYKQSQESSKVAFVINCIKNYGLSISTKKDGSGNHICSKNSFQATITYSYFASISEKFSQAPQYFQYISS